MAACRSTARRWRPGSWRRDVNLGSGGGYVEHFYVKNGYQQVLNIAAPEGYSPAIKAALEQRLHASEVCCIFSKPIAR